MLNTGMKKASDLLGSLDCRLEDWRRKRATGCSKEEKDRFEPGSNPTALSYNVSDVKV
jgi:hypothetical protein